jgi:hypothetical protein
VQPYDPRLIVTLMVRRGLEAETAAVVVMPLTVVVDVTPALVSETLAVFVG